MALPSCVGIHADIVAPYLVHLTTEEQKKRWLPGFCSGELLTAIGMTEPRAAPTSPPQDHRRPDGDDWVSTAPRRSSPTATPPTSSSWRRAPSPEKKARGITLFGVETAADGFAGGRKLDKVGQDESDTAELFFEDVRVTDDDLIGELDNGFIHMMTFLPQERLGSAITNLAHAAQILDETLAVRQGPQGVRPADRQLPAQPVPARRAGHPGRGHPGVRRPVRASRTPRAS